MPNMPHLRIITATLIVYSFSGVYSNAPVSAQAVPDNTLGNESSVVTPNATVMDKTADLIEGGALRDNNLFHSFAEFNIPDGKSVYFANPDGIANILTRVTGNNVSEIFGTLGVNGNANLFLLNPNGIVFGENSALDINGSFLATTADSYLFENDFIYSASNPEALPLLTIDIPIGVQFGTKAESITNLSQAIPPATNSPLGLQISSDASLVFLGGDIIFDGGNVTAAGKVQLASFAPNSLVNLDSDLDVIFDNGTNQNFQDLDFRNLAKVEGEDDITVMGREIILTEGSQIRSNTTDNNPASKLTVLASEKLELLGVGENEFSNVFSGLAKNNLQSGTLDGEDKVDVKTPQLILRNGAKIRVSTEGRGDSGNIEIESESIEATGISDSFSTTVIRSLSFGQGKAGNLKIRARDIFLDTGIISSIPLGDGDGGNVDIKVEELLITNGGQIQSGALAGSGNAGDLRIEAKTINISGISPFRIDPNTNRPTFAEDGTEASSGLLAIVDNRSTGNGGNIFLESDSLSISAGGKISSNTSNMGNAGNILIKAKNIEVRDAFVDFNDSLSGITTDVSRVAVGKGGDIGIEAESLRVLDGGQINAATFGNGDAGNITLNVRDLQVTGIAETEGYVSSIVALSDNSFAAGSIDISANKINISDRGNVSVSNLSNGNSGTLNISSDRLNLDNYAIIGAEVNTGQQGNINLKSNNILLNNHSEITAKASEEATGGNISIDNRDNILLLDNSAIIADSFKGDGGNINITTQGFFVSADSSVDASSKFGLDGNVEVETITSDRAIELDSLPEDPLNAVEQITAGCSLDNNFALVGKGGLPEDPTQYLRGTTAWQDLRTPEFDYLQSEKKVSLIPTFQSPTVSEAVRWTVNSQGKLELIASNNTSDRFAFNSSNCLTYLTKD